MSQLEETPKAVKAAVAVLPDLEAKRAHAEWPFEVGLVPLRFMLVDDTYQRPPHHDFVERGAAEFDPTLVGTIDVSHRGKGSIYAILDGQQRKLMMDMVGKTACYCSIYEGMSIQDEAGFFYRKNRDRKTMSPWYGFRARIVAGDDEPKAILAAVEEQGFTLGPTSNDRDVIGAIRAVETCWAYNAEHRGQCLTPTLVTIRESFMGRKGSLEAVLIQGLGRFWQAFGDDEILEENLRGALGEVGPIGLVGLARESALGVPRSGKGGISVPILVARQIATLYNRTLGQSKKFRADLKRFGG